MSSLRLPDDKKNQNLFFIGCNPAALRVVDDQSGFLTSSFVRL